MIVSVRHTTGCESLLREKNLSPFVDGPAVCSVYFCFVVLKGKTFLVKRERKRKWAPFFVAICYCESFGHLSLVRNKKVKEKINFIWKVEILHNCGKKKHNRGKLHCSNNFYPAKNIKKTFTTL